MATRHSRGSSGGLESLYGESGPAGAFSEGSIPSRNAPSENPDPIHTTQSLSRCHDARWA
jgi:hypothetical protein